MYFLKELLKVKTKYRFKDYGLVKEEVVQYVNGEKIKIK
jgi:hypothetical protein